MPYDFNRLDELIKTEEDQIIAECARDQYHDALDALMSKNIDADIEELDIQKPKDENDIERCAIRATEKRMHKYGKQFFNDELERIMDKYNAKEVDKREYLIRCEVLASVTESLKDFKGTV